MRIPFTQFNVHIPPVVLRHKWKFVIGGVVFVFFILPAFLLTRPKKPEYITAEVTRGNLVQTVEAVGTVTSEKDLDLQFRSAGIVSDVSVKQGDIVRAGQRLASLRAGSLAASIASAQASVQEAQAQLQALLEGARPEDIAIAEASLANKKAALAVAEQALATAQDNEKLSQARLDALMQEAEVTQSGEVGTVPSFISAKVTDADQAITAVQDIFLSSDLQNALIRMDAGILNDVQTQMNNARSSLQSALSSSYSIHDVTSAIAALRQVRIAVSEAERSITAASLLVSRQQLEGYLSASTLASYRTSVNTERAAAQTTLSSVDSEISSIQQTPAALQTRIAAEQASLASAKGSRQRAQSDILTYQTSVRIEQAQLDLKKAPARQTDVAAAQARVNLARASLARAAADYGDTQIIAPVDGVVTKVAIKAGEFTPTGAAITMMGNSPYRIEMFVSEIDVPKLIVSQSGSITLDAFRSTPFTLRVAEIDASATDKDGVPKYRVKLDFMVAPDNLRVGMTGDTTVITGEKDDVLMVPRRAVLDSTTGTGSVVRVLVSGTAEEQPVAVGMEGGSGEVEVLSGLAEGDTVIVLQK